MSSVVRVMTPGEQALSLIQREFPNYHPLVALARLAHRDDVKQDPRLEHDCHKALLPYVVPKLANVEVKVQPNDDRRVIVSLFEQHTLPNGKVIETEVPLITEVSDIVPLD